MFSTFELESECKYVQSRFLCPFPFVFNSLGLCWLDCQWLISKKKTLKCNSAGHIHQQAILFCDFVSTVWDGWMRQRFASGGPSNFPSIVLMNWDSRRNAVFVLNVDATLVTLHRELSFPVVFHGFCLISVGFELNLDATLVILHRHPRPPLKGSPYRILAVSLLLS